LVGTVVVVPVVAAGRVELVDDVELTLAIALCPTGAEEVVGAFTTMSSAGATVVVAARTVVVVVDVDVVVTGATYGV
jgi:hypothetical protein